MNMKIHTNFMYTYTDSTACRSRSNKRSPCLVVPIKEPHISRSRGPHYEYANIHTCMYTGSTTCRKHLRWHSKKPAYSFFVPVNVPYISCKRGVYLLQKRHRGICEAPRICQHTRLHIYRQHGMLRAQAMRRGRRRRTGICCCGRF